MEFIGRSIKEIRHMTEEEMEAEQWIGQNPPVVIVLDNGAKIYPSQDTEGNGPGVLFIQHQSKNYKLT